MEEVVKLLLIDDDEEDIQITSDLLHEQKIRVYMDIARDGVEGLDYLLKRKNKMKELPDLILLDLNMPRKNGIEFLKEMREYEELKLIPVIILTSSQSEQDIEKSYIEGASCFVTKPVGIDEFHKIVNALNDFWFSIVKYPLK